MKFFLLLILSLGLFVAAGCSRSDNETTVKPPSTPDVERLKSDSERLQQATANAAREREKAAQSTATPSPKKDTSPLTVPPSPPNPEP